MGAIAGRPRVIAEHARRMLGESGKRLKGSKALVLGVSYKPALGDVRESPALEIMQMLAEDGLTVCYSDPYVEAINLQACGSLFHLPDPAAHDWDLVIVHTAHPNVDYSWLEGHPAVLDTTYRLQVSGVHVP